MLKNGNESTVQDQDNTPDESGKGQPETVETLKAKLAETKAELEKQIAIKQKLVDEQKEKGKKLSSLREEKSGMEAQLSTLQSQLVDISTRFELVEKDATTNKAKAEKAEARAKAELDALVAKVPTDKKSLLDAAMAGKDTDGKLDLLKEHSKFFLGEAVSASVFAIPKVESQKNEVVTLTQAEKSLIRGVMPEDVALEHKRRDPKYFEKFQKKN